MTTPAQLRADDRPCDPPDVLGARVRVLSTQSTRSRELDGAYGRVVGVSPDDDTMIEIEGDYAHRPRFYVHRSQLMRVNER